MSLKERLKLDQEPVYLIDGSAFFYRGFYAFRDMSRSDGFPTNALFVVLRLLIKLLREERPKHLAFVLDGPGKNFRHDLFKPYKAQRSATPEDLLKQNAPLRRGVELLGIPLIVSEGGEADDCIASLVTRLKAERPVVIMGADKDLNQCLDERVFIWDPALKSEKLATLESFRQEQGMEPGHWPDYQALIGDSSDNIPGVPGIGPKTAIKIMAEHQTLEEIEAHLDELPKTLQAKLREHIKDAYTYRQLTRLRTDFCATLGLKELTWREPDWKQVQDFLAEYEFRSLPRELPQPTRAETAVAAPAAPAEPANAQLSLFSPGANAAVAPAEAETPAAPPLPVREADQAFLLPKRQGRDVGLVMIDGAILLGIGHEELRWTGNVRDLCEALREAASVATPSLKELLHADADWACLPLDRWFDLGLAAYLLNPEERSYDWQRLRDSLALDPDAEAVHPQANGLAAKAMHDVLAKRLAAANLTELLCDLEMPLVPVLVAMEQAGIAIDKAAFESFLSEVNAQIGELTTRIHAVAEMPFNIRSNQQLAQLLFDRLGLKAKGKTPGGAQSTANPVLEKLRNEHPVVADILEFRMLEKLRSTYLEPLPKLADEQGRIHTTFNQLATATGRLSSSAPNLQNIPIRGPQGTRMRACFTAGPGCLLAAADYSQIELRVLAHMSQDPTLLEAFRHGQDIHARTAGLIFDKDASQIAPDERRSAKTINFGLLYGMGPQKLAAELGIALTQAKEFIERYFVGLSKLKEFYDSIVQEAEQNGSVVTMLGRRRLLPDIHSRNDNLKAQAVRQAINTRIQGSAADIIKLAMIRAHADERIKELGGRLILQVHDELLLETPEATAQAAGARMKEIMAGIVELSVPLVVDMGVGRNWAEAH
ncbi:DNA polymerase I [Desulfocurvibacter africanus PCS]|uniref:DNA polymerase I n=1 Tax=Desulfocurvibacter africanus PCS TaxID=1262666 RepID=M5Q198_DESAF|nr:DNA polymerase I [Desulfocurvibacter africanus]EMG36368.1 DNA polymerase I [Desulfocurvibacter africanus PCS]